jgi:glycosyltransferase involved in cell wall biosynthesis
MKVELIELKTSFLPYNIAGKKFYGYPYYLYESLKKLNNYIFASKLTETKSLGKGLSILTKTLFMDFSNYDILHNLDLNPFFPSRGGKAIIITTAHDFQFALKPELNEDVTHSVRDRIWINLITRLGLKSTLASDYIIAVSTLTKEDAIKLGYPKKQIFVVNHGISKAFFKPLPEKHNKGFVVGYLGALRTRKNPEFMIEAFKHIKSKQFEMHIYGKFGYNRNKIIDIAKDDRQIKFMGFAPEDKLVNIYDSFNAFVFPSHYEGFGIPIIEAQSRGLPVIIYKYGKIPKEVRKYCFEAESPEHMAQIIEDLKENGYNEKLRKKAMGYARSFTWEKTAKKTVEIYKKCI